MKCSTCGYDYLSKLTGCTRCGHRAARSTQKPSQTKLIEFPVKQRMAEKQEQSKTSIPAWRAELSEKVREIRAKKEELTTTSQPATLFPGDSVPPDYTPSRSHFPITTVEREKVGAVTRTKFSSRPTADEIAVAGVSRVESSSVKRSNTKLVQDALTRVQRASENARRSGLSRIEPSRPTPTTSSLNVDRQATARVLESPSLDAEIQPVIQTRQIAYERRVTQPLHTPAPISAIAVVTQPLIRQDPDLSNDVELVDTPVAPPDLECVKQLDEDHCLDYLEAEVERVDRKLHELMEIQDGVGMGTHLVINLVDLCVIGLSCAPFLALIKILNGKFDDAGTQQAAAGIILLIAAFYFLLTQLLSNRTFGMMVTSTKLVSSSTLNKPTPVMIFTRTAGYAVSLLVALIGFFWIAVDSQQRSLHDRISGTIVVSDM
jgi:uncharacterized RDD family membrane protein YckC